MNPINNVACSRRSSDLDLTDGIIEPTGDGLNAGRGFAVKVDSAKVLLLGVAYCGVIIFAHWMAYLVRFEFHPPGDSQTLFWDTLQWILPLELAFLFAFGQFRSLLSYFSLPDARRVVMACAAAALVATGTWYATSGRYAPPRSIILLGFIMDTFGLVGVRLVFRMIREGQRANGEVPKAPRRVVIVGAGDVGANLAKEMISRRDIGMTPVAFFDDDRTKWTKRIHGVPVLGRPELLTKIRLVADEAIIAMPSASGRRVRQVVQVFNEARLRFETVPSLEQMVNGRVKVSQIRPVEIEDLLGREAVRLSAETIAEIIRDKIVMVTGAGGSIGSELCRQIAGYHPQRLLVVERCEVQIFQIEQELLGAGCGAQIVPLVADILDKDRMHSIFDRFRPQLVFHAAAHKHVPMMESQPYEAFRNNTVGTKRLAKLSMEYGVERFVLISTDKAINPTNAMGVTKRLAELYLQALQNEITKGYWKTAGRTEKLEVSAATDQDSGEECATVISETQRLELVDAAHQAPGSSSTVAAEPILTATFPAPLQSASTKLMAVRFGNVLGSSGSVIPTFRKQIAAGGPVTVTHPEVTRYFMTTAEAVGLVLQSATLGEGGEIFVLDMGKLVKIADLARQMIELSGLKPDIDIEIKFTGLRPGEKLFEEINHRTENMVPTKHPKIMRFVGEPLPFETLRQGLLAIQDKAVGMEANQVKLEFKKLLPEYKPFLE